MIHWELCKKFKFDNRNKWDMHNPESVLESETNKILWNFVINMDNKISTKRPDRLIVNKKENRPKSGLCCPDWPRGKTEENEPRDKYQDIAR